MNWVIRYSQKDAPVPDGWRFELLKNHYAPERGYGVLIKEDKDQVLVAVYPDGLLVTINGKSHKKVMTDAQMVSLAKRLLEACNV